MFVLVDSSFCFKSQNFRGSQKEKCTRFACESNAIIATAFLPRHRKQRPHKRVSNQKRGRTNVIFGPHPKLIRQRLPPPPPPHSKGSTSGFVDFCNTSITVYLSPRTSSHKNRAASQLPGNPARTPRQIPASSAVSPGDHPHLPRRRHLPRQRHRQFHHPVGVSALPSVTKPKPPGAPARLAAPFVEP